MSTIHVMHIVLFFSSVLSCAAMLPSLLFFSSSAPRMHTYLRWMLVNFCYNENLFLCGRNDLNHAMESRTNLYTPVLSLNDIKELFSCQCQVTYQLILTIKQRTNKPFFFFFIGRRIFCQGGGLKSQKITHTKKHQKSDEKGVFDPVKSVERQCRENLDREKSFVG